MSKLINDDLPTPPARGPVIIEITGLPGTCKRLIGQTIAKRFGIEYRNFPDFSPMSLTGRVLIQAIGNEPDRFPNWWALISAANLYEHQYWLSQPGPKIVTNYKSGFKAWMTSCKAANVKELVSSLPEPNLTFGLIGKTYTYPNDLESNHSAVTLTRLNNYFTNNLNLNIVTLNTKDKEFKAKGINNRLNLVADHITQYLHEKYKWPVVSKKQIEFKYINGKVAEHDKV